MRTLETVEASKASTSAHDAGQADVEKTRNVVEAPQDVGKEEEVPELQTKREEPQPQQQQEWPSQLQPEAEQRELS
jgi:hypothetical protein